MGNVKKRYNVDVQSVSSLGATERCFLCLYSFTFWYIDIINSMLINYYHYLFAMYQSVLNITRIFYSEENFKHKDSLHGLKRCKLESVIYHFLLFVNFGCCWNFPARKRLWPLSPAQLITAVFLLTTPMLI